MKLPWKSSLFNFNSAAFCMLCGSTLFYGIKMIAKLDDFEYGRALGFLVSTIHMVLVVYSLNRRQWRLDFDSYMDFLVLIGGVIFAPIYCLLYSRRPLEKD